MTVGDQGLFSLYIYKVHFLLCVELMHVLGVSISRKENHYILMLCLLFNVSFC
jgi:hypothetical protein